MKRIIAFVLMAILLFTLAGCAGNKILGKWEFSSGENKGIMEFFKNGEGLIYDASDINSKMTFKYEILNKEQLKLITDGFEEIIDYKLKDNKITMISEGVILEGVRLE